MKAWFKQHYHWVIAGIVLIQLMICGGMNNNLSLFTIPVSESFGISRATFSLANSLKYFTAFLGTIFSGVFLLRFGYRRSVLFCMAITISALSILSASSNIGLYCLGYAVLGLADGVCISAGPPRIISVWFHRHQGTVLGMVTAATGLGGSLICLMLSGAIEATGWNSAFIYSAVLMTVLAFGLLLLVRDHPRDMGLRPYGEGQAVAKKKVHMDHWIGYTRKEMLRAPAFYLMILGTFISCVFSGGALAVMVPHLQDRGLSAQEAATMQSILMLALAAVKLCCGILTDRIGAKWVMMLCLAGTAICLALFAITSTPAIALLAVLFFAISLPLTSVMISLLSNALFGYQEQTFCVGIFLSMVSLASVIAAPLANTVFDRIGTYVPAFWVAAAGTVLLMGMYFVMYKLADRDKRRILAAEQNQ